MINPGNFCHLTILTLLIATGTHGVNASTVAAEKKADPHYTPSGFFDIHLCNWPNRPPFYMALYSTEQYDNIKSVEVLNPNNKVIGHIDLEKFRVINRKNKPEKHVFMSQLEAPADDPDGWFSAKITLANGVVDNAKDFVIHHIMPRAGNQLPPNHAEDIPMPSELKWSKIQEAAYYQVFIKDLWNDGKLIYSSELLKRPSLKLPEGLIEAGGYYAWKVHARDVNEHILLGDFNIGSLTEWIEFSVSSD